MSDMNKIRLINQLNQNQKDMYLITVNYSKICDLHKKKCEGVELSKPDRKYLARMSEILDRQGITVTSSNSKVNKESK